EAASRSTESDAPAPAKPSSRPAVATMPSFASTTNARRTEASAYQAGFGAGRSAPVSSMRGSHGLAQATVDDDVRPGEVREPRAGEDGHQVGHLARLREAPGDHRLLGAPADVVGGGARGRGDGVGDAAVPEPEVGRDGAGTDR